MYPIYPCGAAYRLTVVMGTVCFVVLGCRDMHSNEGHEMHIAKGILGFLSHSRTSTLPLCLYVSKVCLYRSDYEAWMS
jgi:hypothetical protein